MSGRPTTEELAKAIEEFLAGEILPTLSDPRLRFRTLVALNALGIVERELAKLPGEDDAEQRELAARIRADDGLRRYGPWIARSRPSRSPPPTGRRRPWPG